MPEPPPSTLRLYLELHIPAILIFAAVAIAFVMIAWVTSKDPEKEVADGKLGAKLANATRFLTRAKTRSKTLPEAKPLPGSEGARGPSRASSPPGRSPLVSPGSTGSPPVPESQRLPDSNRSGSSNKPESNRSGSSNKSTNKSLRTVKEEPAGASASAPPSPPSSPPPSPPEMAGLDPEEQRRLARDLRALGADSSMSGWETAFSVKNGLMEKLKILITHFQISMSFPESFDIQWPDWHIDFSAFSFLKVEFMQLMQFECLYRLRFYDSLFFTVVSAAVVLLTIPVVATICLSMQSIRWKLGGREKTPSAMRARSQFVDRMWNIFLFLCFFLFPPVSTTLWKTLRCIELEPGRWALWADLSVSCYDSEYYGWMIFALAGIAVFTLGIPIFFILILLRNHRRLVLQTPHCKARYGFLYQKYSDKAWYWEIVEMIRKVVFTSVVMFFAGGTSSQIVIAMAISFACLMLHMRVRAYREQSDISLQTVSQTCIFLTLFLGLLIRENVIIEIRSLLETVGLGFLVDAFTLAISVLPAGFGLIAMVQSTCGVLAKSQVLGYLCGACGGTACCALGSGEGDVAVKQAAMLNLAVALSADDLGDHLSENKQKVDAKLQKRQESQEARKEERALTRSGSITGSKAAGLTREPSASGSEAFHKAWDSARDNKGKTPGKPAAEEADDEPVDAELAAVLDEHMRLTRNGTPKVGSDPTRGKFLVKLRVSIEAIVVRHYPVGKGFLVRLKEEAKPPPAEGGGEAAPLTRPPYLFIKIWSEKHEANNTGFVNVRYDLRDTGFKIDPEKVIYHPDGANEYNKQLIVWEAKMKQATREKAESEVLAAAGMKTMVV